MALTTAQLQALQADIAAAPEFAGIPNTPDGAFAIAEAYNATAAPDYWVWATSVPTHTCKQAMVWTEYIARSQGERDAWQFMLADGVLNAADANVRQGIQDIFSGPGGAGSRAALIAVLRRRARRIERLFATGGDGSTTTPATMAFEGTVTYLDVAQARTLP